MALFERAAQRRERGALPAERCRGPARRVAGATIGLTVFLNLAGFVVGVAGWASFVVVIVLVIALFFMFRPAANAFVDERSGDPWRGVE